MTLLASKTLIAAKIEAARGTAIATAAADAILIAGSPSLTPLAGETVNRELVRKYFGASPDIPVNVHQTLEFQVELAGLAAAPTALKLPAWGVLLRACGMKETFTAATGSGNDLVPAHVIYAPHSDTDANSGAPGNSLNDSLTLRYNVDGQLHVLAGCRGTWSLALQSSQIPRFTFRFIGLWADPASTAAPAADTSRFQDPSIASNANTPTFELLGQTDLQLQSLSLDYAAAAAHREVIGADPAVHITDRDPSGSVTVDADPLSSLNPFTKAETGAAGALKLVHGSAVGKTIQIDCPKVQLAQPSYGDDGGFLQWTSAFKVLPKASAGNDELTIKVS